MCLLLGAITSLAVAWLIAKRGTRLWEGYPLVRAAWVIDGASKVGSLTVRRLNVGFQEVRVTVTPGTIRTDQIDVYMPRGFAGENPPPYRRNEGPPRPCRLPAEDRNCRTENHFGWPVECMWTGYDSSELGCTVFRAETEGLWRLWPMEVNQNPSPLAAPQEDVFGPFYAYRGKQSWFVPARPLVRGMAIDTGVYAGAWYALLIVPGRIRVHVRRRCCRCISCGYSLAGNTSGVCPECGQAEMPKAGAPA